MQDIAVRGQKNKGGQAWLRLTVKGHLESMTIDTTRLENFPITSPLVFQSTGMVQNTLTCRPVPTESWN